LRYALKAFDPFTQTPPFQLESISVMNNMSEFSVRPQGLCECLIEQDGKLFIRRIAVPQEKIRMPGITGRKGELIICMNPFENVFYAVIELRQKGAGRGFSRTVGSRFSRSVFNDSGSCTTVSINSNSMEISSFRSSGLIEAASPSFQSSW